jgi:hypothetical protein
MRPPAAPPLCGELVWNVGVNVKFCARAASDYT